MAPPPRWLIVVERDRPDVYERLARAFDEGVEVVLDRRRGDRRQDDASPQSGPIREERRRGPRRQPLPAAESAFAEHAGFFLVSDGAAGPSGPDLAPDVGDAPPAPGEVDLRVGPGREGSALPRVLVCDDDALVRDSLVEALAGEFAVETAVRRSRGRQSRRARASCRGLR
jgi:hypothetical protein